MHGRGGSANWTGCAECTTYQREVYAEAWDAYAVKVREHQAAREAKAREAEVVAPPTRTPWRSLNARLEAPAGLQLTLYQDEVD